MKITFWRKVGMVLGFVMLALFALSLISGIASCVKNAFAHPGRTDSQGGHYDRSTGEYHYHHGYPAHQHPDGVCPYNYSDRTGADSGASGTVTVEVAPEPTEEPTPEATSGTITLSMTTEEVKYTCAAVGVGAGLFYLGMRKR